MPWHQNCSKPLKNARDSFKTKMLEMKTAKQITLKVLLRKGSHPAERLVCNQEVGGSILVVSITRNGS